MNLRRLLPRLALLPLLGIAGCSWLCSDQCLVMTPKGGTVPTCPGCTLTWGPNPTIAAGTVQLMVKNYTKATLMFDSGLPTAQETLIGMMSNNQAFSEPVTPPPGTRPTTVWLYLYYPYDNLLLRDVIKTFTIH